MRKEKNVQLKIVGEKLQHENHTEPTSPKYKHCQNQFQYELSGKAENAN